MVLESYNNTIKSLKLLQKRFSDDIIDNILQYILFDIDLNHLSRNKLYLILENSLLKKGLFDKGNTYARSVFKRYLSELKRYQILHMYNMYNVPIYSYCINSNQNKTLKETIGNYCVLANTIRFKDTIINENDCIDDIKIMRIFDDNNIIISKTTKCNRVLYVHLDYLLYHTYIRKQRFEFFSR